MARFKITFGRARIDTKEGTGDSRFPSAEWIAKNRHTKRFQNIISRSWKSYINKINRAYKKQYRVGAEASNVAYFPDVMERRAIWKKAGEYPRAHNLPKKKGLGHAGKVKTSAKSDKLMLSKELFRTVSSCQLSFDDKLSRFGYRILTPSNKSDYIDLDEIVNMNGNGRNYYLSDFLENTPDFNFQHTALPAGFEKGGQHYVIAEDRMLKALKEEEGSQSKRKR